MIKVVNFDSGVRLIMENIENIRTVSVGIWVDVGSSSELKKEDFGASHFIEHMLFKGTKKRSSFDIVNEIDRIGGQQNAFTGKEKTCYYIKVLDNHFDIAADVLTDMISNPTFDSLEIEREKLVVCEEINMNLDDPDDLAIDNLERIIYGGTPMSHPVLGSKESVMSFTKNSITEYYNKHYCKNNLVISVAGSFDEDEVISYFENAFAELATNDIPSFEFELPDYNKVSGYNEINKDIEQAHLAIGIKSIPYNDERKYALKVLNTLIGGGMSSRLFQHIREKKGLAYSIHSSLGFNKNTGIFVIEAGVSKENVQKALAGIKEELDILKNHKVSDSEIISAKEQLKSSYIFSSENIQSRMILNGIELLNDGVIQSQDEVISSIDSITNKDLETVKEIIYDYNKYSVVNVCNMKGTN